MICCSNEEYINTVKANKETDIRHNLSGIRIPSGIKGYIEHYNNKRPHQGIDHQIPMTKYAKIAA